MIYRVASEFPYVKKKRPRKKKKQYKPQTYDAQGHPLPLEEIEQEEEPEKPVVKKKAGPLFNVNWFRVILDEAQIIKNKSTRSAQGCYALKASRRWCLSGTPIQVSFLAPSASYQHHRHPSV
jgi:SNF2 family DNA or RNA helicase